MKHALVFVVLAIGCGAYRAQPIRPVRVDAELPNDVGQLLSIADSAAALGPDGPDHRRSRAAAEKALSLSPSSGAAWRAARATYFLASAADGAPKSELSARCIDVSAIAVETATTAEPFFYQALCMAVRAQARSVEGLALVKQMVEAGKRARDIDPKALHAGADRLLGGVFLRAPAWPASLGDLDAALEHLERAVQIAPNWAENHLLLAEALLDDDRQDEARAALDEAKRWIEAKHSKGWRTQWRRELAVLQKRLD